jgi:hypothetical protein
MVTIIANTIVKGEALLLTNIVSQVQVVTFAVFLEGGDLRAIDTEDVAIRANKLAPGRFTWRKYPEQVNLELVRVYLSEAKSPTQGGLVVGTGRTGWSLTPEGLEWARGASKSFKGQDLSRSRDEISGGSVDENRWRRERARVLATNAWQKWNDGRAHDIVAKDAAEVFRIDSYAEGRMRTMKLTRLRSLLSGDADLLAFLKAMADLLEQGA